MEHRGDNSLLAETLDFVGDVLFFASKWVPASINWNSLSRRSRIQLSPRDYLSTINSQLWPNVY